MSKNDKKHQEEELNHQENIGDQDDFLEDEEDKEPEVDEQNNEWENKYKRALADYQNLEKRMQNDRVRWIQTANRELIAKLLPVLDTLKLAEKHTNDEGIKLSITQFVQALQTEGAEIIKTVGQEFNPHTMEAIGTAEGKENKVVEEVRIGVTIGEYVIRPAQVIVGKEE